jgi:hypothetical protein
MSGEGREANWMLDLKKGRTTMPRLTVFAFLIMLIGFHLAPSPVDAQLATGQPDLYQVTINSFEMSSDNGSNYTEVGSGGLTFNIAAVNAGAQVGEYFAGGSPLSPSTTYNRMRVTVSCTFLIRGCVLSGGQQRCTQSGSNAPGDPPAATSSITMPTDVCPNGQQVQFESPEGQVSFTTNAAGGLEMTMNFNTATALALYTPTVIGPGNVSVSFTQP